MEALPVTALKNWLICRRQVYFAHSLGLHPLKTEKMTEGRLAQQEIERLESRRTLERYGVGDRKRLFGLRLFSEGMLLSGNPDLVLQGTSQAAIVEFKLTIQDPDEAAWLQLACYAALYEDARSVPVDLVFVYRIPDERVFRAKYTGAWRTRLNVILGEVRDCVSRQIDPGPTQSAAICTDCPYRNFCADMW